MLKTKPAYTTEFKNGVLAYQTSTGTSPRLTAEHFGVSANSLREWQRRAGAPAPAPREPRPANALRDTKKTVAIFSDPSANAMP